MLEMRALIEKLDDLKIHSRDLRGVFDFNCKKTQLSEIRRELEDPNLWNDPKKAQLLNQKHSKLESLVQQYDNLEQEISDAASLVFLLKEEDDESLRKELHHEIERLKNKIKKMLLQQMFPKKTDLQNAYLDIQSGSGGTEAQDWAEMLLRMYLRWGAKHEFVATVLEISPGEIAGIKSATVKFEGEYSYGWLRTETGIHRLVRKSPFDSGNRRHTSFASVFVSPEEIEEDTDVKISPASLRIDTYRASGAGGQHVNRTDSAVRITHIPTGIVVQCQSDRSQHKNKSQAMKQLQAKLYKLKMMKKNEEKSALESSKSEITWGSQIRSYVLDTSRVRDLRTGMEIGNAQAVLDGNIDPFIESYLKKKK
ncbi:peptide chain release factor 2 [Coxiella endosymbiont of Amblyomma sculptum]|uniref:peptide chain release factor 2 n=1 Tax=Coxiella endosymbiont of Amblyomma sculptum TaxID=2487929 RepID=UPI00132EB769|nr:peptide chain release factor 2 [Coxiella endosymbiont of Amblyomma sculptum]QHG92496.1 peptide chain release factor 2 [Coxiella endosymbiont of Amblyomma sculptum]